MGAKAEKDMEQTFETIVKAVMIGHAVGDALGVPFEFNTRDELEENPVKEMCGYGPFPMPAGSWSDDTSMALCTLESLTKGFVDYDDIMLNFGRWYYKDEFTPTGEMFDAGNTCTYAIDNYFVHKKPTNLCGLRNASANGNGSLMRIHPMALYLYQREDLTLDEKLSIIHYTSALTHAHERSKTACGIYAFVLWSILDEKDKFRGVRRGLSKARKYYRNKSEELAVFDNLFRRIGLIDWHYEDPDTFKPASGEDIKSGGYVVDTIEAAMFCLLKSNSYKDCVLKAVNLGDDTDTVAAVAGGLAGALYGYESIPQEWRDTLIKRDYIEELCAKASACWEKHKHQLANDK